MMKICKHCNSTYNPDEIYCPKCGAFETIYPVSKAKHPAETIARPAARVETKPAPQPAARIENKPAPQTGPAPKFTGRLLKSFSMISLYEGEPTIGVARATGDLLIYDDRIVFKRKLGNALGGAFGLIGVAVAYKKAQKLGDVVLRYDQIKRVCEGRYMGCMPTIVVTDRYGLRLSFAGSLNGSALREAIQVMQGLIA